MRSFAFPMLLMMGVLLLLLPTAHAVPAIDQGPLKVSGTWQPETIDAETVGTWVPRADRLRLIFPTNTSGEYGQPARKRCRLEIGRSIAGLYSTTTAVMPPLPWH